MKPVKTKDFKRFLVALGLEHQRTKGDHEIWNHPQEPYSRPVVFRTHLKEIPPTHIRTNLRTLGMTEKEFEEFLSQK